MDPVARQIAAKVAPAGATAPAAPGATVWQRIEVEQRTASRRVDFIFVLRGLESMTGVRSSRVVLDRPGRLPDGAPLWPSDHYGVFAEIEIAPKPVMAMLNYAP